eukprot:TRINITY_DN5131_c0_g1_i1.p1 TRINITY_DN5131_c0_g1~~TRINITY_DN5131_c0_g1_i1.p1  ORF type:complete len:811 (-),score=193.33 TRINITY_DN5131_c0_g1_i1:725-3130(-)
MASERKWDVHKFGGTSVNGAARYRNVLRLALQFKTETPTYGIGIVVSAMSGVTDSLYKLVYLALDGKEQEYKDLASFILKRHIDCLEDLFSDKTTNPPKELCELIEGDIRDILDVLRAVLLSKSCSESLYELVSGYGELWSSKILASYVNLMHPEIKCRALDARRVLVVENQSDNRTNILWGKSETKMREYLKETEDTDDILIITGYVASTENGLPTTLKRNGSDFSGAIFGALLRAQAITIWTDVDGVYSADPRKVKGAVMLDEMSYEEAMELAFFGAKVLHPHTMAPAVMHGIPIYIKNTFNSTCPGTKIHKSSCLSNPAMHIVKGISSIENIALINLEGSGMIGVPGICQRLFSGLKDHGLSVIMISQASSEHSICFAVPLNQADTACKSVRESFFRELATGQILTIDVKQDCAILAIVGDGMKTTAGVAARVCGALAQASVNCVAIAQGSSERNISIVVTKAQATTALQAVHAAYFVPKRDPKTLVYVLANNLSSDVEAFSQEKHGFADKVVFGGFISKDSAWMPPTPVAVLSAEDISSSSQAVNPQEAISKINQDCEKYAQTVVIDISSNPSFSDLVMTFSKSVKVLSANPSKISVADAFLQASTQTIRSLEYLAANERIEKVDLVLPNLTNEIMAAFVGDDAQGAKLLATFLSGSPLGSSTNLDLLDDARAQTSAVSKIIGAKIDMADIKLDDSVSLLSSIPTAQPAATEVFKSLSRKGRRLVATISNTNKELTLALVEYESTHPLHSQGRFGCRVYGERDSSILETYFASKIGLATTESRIKTTVSQLRLLLAH